MLNITDLSADITIHRLLRDLCAAINPAPTETGRYTNPRIHKRDSDESVYFIRMPRLVKTNERENGVVIFWDKKRILFRVLRPTLFEKPFRYRSFQGQHIVAVRDWLAERLRVRGVEC